MIKYHLEEVRSGYVDESIKGTGEGSECLYSRYTLI